MHLAPNLFSLEISPQRREAEFPLGTATAPERSLPILHSLGEGAAVSGPRTSEIGGLVLKLGHQKFPLALPGRSDEGSGEQVL